MCLFHLLFYSSIHYHSFLQEINVSIHFKYIIFGIPHQDLTLLITLWLGFRIIIFSWLSVSNFLSSSITFWVLFVPSPKCCCFLGFYSGHCFLFILQILPKTIAWILTTYDPATDDPHLSAQIWCVSRASETSKVSGAYWQLHT